MAPLGEPDPGEQLVGRAGRAVAAQLERDLHVLARGERRDELERLEHEPDLLAPEPRQRVFVERAEILPVQACQCEMIGNARIQSGFGYMPLIVRARRYQVSVHCPVNIRRQGQSVPRIIIRCLRERMKVGGLHHGSSVWENDSQTGCSATIVVYLGHHSAKCRVSYRAWFLTDL